MLTWNNLLHKENLNILVIVKVNQRKWIMHSMEWSYRITAQLAYKNLVESVWEVSSVMAKDP